jgi:hypothetical protein
LRESIAEQAQQDFSVAHILVCRSHPVDERDLRGNPHLTLGDSAVRLVEMLELQLAVYYESSERALSSTVLNGRRTQKGSARAVSPHMASGALMLNSFT